MAIHPMTDAEFQAEQDMNVLVEAAEITKDSGRMTKAKVRALDKARELEEAAATIAPPTDDGVSPEDALAQGFTKLP